MATLLQRNLLDHLRALSFQSIICFIIRVNFLLLSIQDSDSYLQSLRVLTNPWSLALTPMGLTAISEHFLLVITALLTVDFAGISKTSH